MFLFKDSTLLGAIIGAIATLLAALIPILNSIKWTKEKSRFVAINKKTKENLRGFWVGHTKVRDDIYDRQYQASVTFEPSGRGIKGTMHIRRENENNRNEFVGWTLDFVGGFIRDGYLQIDYWNPDKNVCQFGSIIYKYTPGNLDGHFVAFGRDLQTIIYGEAVLKKQP